MKQSPAAPAVDPNDEIVGLVRILHETQKRLQELTGGQVDAVLHQGGQSYLLHEAQGKLRESESNQRHLATTLTAILNALPAHICLLDADGQIISINQSWRLFALFNHWPDPEQASERNYLQICDRATGPGAKDAHQTAAGIRAVLSGESEGFTLEYPCDTPDKKLWFQVVISPVGETSPGGAVVMHIDITERKQAEESMRQSEERFRNMFTAAATGIAISTPEGRFIQANDAYCRMLGYTEKELLTRSFASITHPGDLPKNLKLRDELLAGQRKSFTMETRYIGKQGNTVWTRHSVASSHAIDGKISALIVVAEDITEMKMAEVCLQATMKSLAASQAIAHLGSWEIDLTQSDDYALAPHSCSDEMYRILGYEPQSVPVSADFFFGNIPAEYQEEVKNQITALISDRKEHTFTHPIIRPSGERRFIRSVAQVVVDEKSDRLLKVVGTAQDITEAQAAAEALRATASSLAVSQSIAHLGSWEMDLVHLDNLRANPLRWSDEMYRIFGYLPQSIPVTPDFYLQHVPGAERDMIEQRLQEVLRDNQQRSYFYPIKRSGGEIRIVHTQAQIVMDDKTGRPYKMFGTVHDVTEAKRNEEHFLAETALLEAQLNSTLDGILVISPDGRKILQNQRAVDIWKIPREFAHETDHKRRFEWIASQVRDKEPFLEKVRYLYANPDAVGRDEIELIDGRFVDRYSAPIRGQDGRYYGRIWVYRDITDRKVAEQKASEQMELMTMAGRIGKLGAWAAEYPGPKLKWSSEIYSIFEVELDFPLDHQSGLRFFAPESRRRFEAAIESKEPFDLELEIITGKGNRRWVRTTNAIDIKEGEVKRYYGVLQDITEQKRTEARTRRLVDSNVQGVLFWTSEGEIKEANDAFLQLIGYTRDDLKAGRISWKAMTPAEYDDADQNALREIAEKGICTPYQKEYIAKNGKRVPVLIGSAAFDDSPDEGICFVLDLSDQKRLEQQFLRAQRMESIGTLAGGIAHDLNNILAPIMMAVQVLKMKTTEPQLKTILETIEVSSKRGADIVRQVLSFARGLQGERVEVQPIHLLKDIETIIRDTFPKNIRRDVFFPEEAWTIQGDPTQLHQILLNLCVNARDAMPDGGSLSISVENVHLDDQYVAMNVQAKPGKYVIINVTDSGEGIPAEILDKIFDPFFTTKEVGKGTGLGLSTVMAIVKSHGGFVNVYSEVGKGSSFKVYLPALEKSAQTQRDTVSLATLPRGNGERILIVDDEISILTITSQTLEAFGYKTMTANDGAEAIAIYAQHRNKIAVVLTDMAMPVMDGPATIRALLKVNPAAKIIAATGLKTEGSEAKALNAGVKHFLSKPYTASTLLKTLRTVLDEAKKAG
jgi:PAS domain S-box-containing protein